MLSVPRGEAYVVIQSQILLHISTILLINFDYISFLSLRFDSEKAGDREVQRTMLELLNQLDGFSSTTDIKVIAATNRVDILDPALLRSESMPIDLQGVPSGRLT